MTGSADRTIFKVAGPDRIQFLQGLVTNDVSGLADDLVYAALLTPQGKYLADFFLVPWDDAVLLDVSSDLAAGLLQRLSMYKLRADVTIDATDLQVGTGVGSLPAGAFTDPRHPALGWRMYGYDPAHEPDVGWDSIRVKNCIPETGIELSQDSYILEAGFERLHGVDFRKGCYVGQEVTARMKHKTELRKGLRTVLIEGQAPAGTPITSGGKQIGHVFTQADGKAIAYLRIDRIGETMTAQGATLRLMPEVP